MNEPTVTALIVVRNGSRDITGALDSIRQQDYGSIELVVVDGMSDDGTRRLVTDYAATHKTFPLRLLDNPGRIQATGWNVGIRAAFGQYLLRLDAVHCRLQPDYIRRCLEKLRALQQADPWVAAVGGRRVSVAAMTNGWSEAIALAQSSRFGVGNAAYRLSTTPGFADTLGVPLYDRSILQKVGMFDESLGRSEDNELHARLRDEGYKLYFLPEVTATYHPRTTLNGIASQMFHNGWWVSATVLRIRRFPFGVRHIVPFTFYLALFVAGILSVAGFVWSRWVLSVLAGAYLVFSLAAALHVSRSRGFWRTAIVFWLMHACYAAGTAAGLLAGKNGPAVGEITAPGASVGA